MQTYECLLQVVCDNGRYEKVIDLPFVPQVGMTIYRGGAQLMWEGLCDDIHHSAPPITRVGYNIDEDQFDVEILVNRKVNLTSTYWDAFFPL